MFSFFYTEDGFFLGGCLFIEESLWVRGGTPNIRVNESWGYEIDDVNYYFTLPEEERWPYVVNGNYHSEVTFTTNSATLPPNNPPWWKYDVGWVDSMYGVTSSDKVDTKLEIVTGGFTNSLASSVFKLTVSVIHHNTVDTSTGELLNPQLVPDADITVLGKNPTNGIIYIVLQDNTTNQNATPVVPATYSNLAYSVTAERVKIPITFRNTGTLMSASGQNRPGVSE